MDDGLIGRLVVVLFRLRFLGFFFRFVIGLGFENKFSTGIHRRFGIMIWILHIVIWFDFLFLFSLFVYGEFRFALLVAILSLVLQWIFSC